ncbi:hypothetical protein CEXT_781151 [Caerostris extrusa]|uniref:Uncharacterized protein n=1 Tax=Caerostris extrusa TaxID=172846 RepID=A0AAV4YAD2_CAEEX|nr:hypothetical protein CEXT_781151 [Caerostris extrusa]
MKNMKEKRSGCSIRSISRSSSSKDMPLLIFFRLLFICQTCGAPLGGEHGRPDPTGSFAEVNAIRENTQASTVKILNIMDNEKGLSDKTRKT